MLKVSMCCLLFGLIAMVPIRGATEATATVGKAELSIPIIPIAPDVRDPKVGALQIIIWYPAAAAHSRPDTLGPQGSPLFFAGVVAADAPLADHPGKFPLVVISHGTGGSAMQMAWLGTRLAARGFIAAAVNHPGNTTATGYTAAGFTLWWLRAHDVSETISALFNDKRFAGRIDRSRVAAAGFSLGGYTVLELAGARTSLKRFAAYCARTHWQYCDGPREYPKSESKTLAAARTDAPVKSALDRQSDDYRDHRVKAVFAIAPAVIPALIPDSLSRISVPVYLVAGSGDPIVNVRDNAFMVESLVPNAELHVFPRDVQHYTFLDQCTPTGFKKLRDLCVTEPSRQREIENEAAKMAADFFDKALHR